MVAGGERRWPFTSRPRLRRVPIEPIHPSDPSTVPRCVPIHTIPFTLHPSPFTLQTSNFNFPPVPVEAKPLFRPDVLRTHLEAFVLPEWVEPLRAKVGQWGELVGSGQIER